MNNTRRHLVNFRVTDQELEQIRTASELQGARCVSEFARTLMLGSIHQGRMSSCSEDQDHLQKLQSHNRRLVVLEQKVARLLELFPALQNAFRDEDDLEEISIQPSLQKVAHR